MSSSALIRQITLLLPALLLMVFPLAFASGPPSTETSQPVLTWSLPTTNTDGSRLHDLAGFRLHIGTQSGKYDEVIDVGMVDSYRLANSIPGRRYFVAVSAYTRDGAESALSSEVVVTSGDTAQASATAEDAGRDVAINEFVISAGLEGGGYYEVARRLSAVLDRNGSRSRVLASQGSVQNLKRLTAADHETSVALAQADVFGSFLSGAPEHADSTSIVDAWGDECLFAIVAAHSDLQSDRDLKKGEVSIAVAGPDSGPAATVRYLKELEPGFGGIRLLYMTPEEALSRLSMGPSGEGVDVVLLVQHPKARPPVMTSVLEDFERYRFLAIKGRGITARLPDGKPVYKRVQITPAPMSGISVETICTRRLLIGNKAKLGEARLAALAALVKSHWRDIYVRPASAGVR